MPVDAYSCCVLPLEAFNGGQSLGQATGFLYAGETGLHLITNWHIATGIGPTGICLWRGAMPDTLVATFNSGRQVTCPLYERGAPAWREHPRHRKSVDVVALPIRPPELERTWPINEARSQPKMVVRVGMDVFVLGFPFGAQPTGSFPVWKRGSIATEPDIPLDNLPKFYVDTATRPGMSGSPVIMRTWGFYRTGEDDFVAHGGPHTKLVGVYSARLTDGSGEVDEVRAQLGVVWHASVVEEIVRAGVPGAAP